MSENPDINVNLFLNLAVRSRMTRQVTYQELAAVTGPGAAASSWPTLLEGLAIWEGDSSADATREREIRQDVLVGSMARGIVGLSVEEARRFKGHFGQETRMFRGKLEGGLEGVWIRIIDGLFSDH